MNLLHVILWFRRFLLAETKTLFVIWVACMQSNRTNIRCRNVWSSHFTQILRGRAHPSSQAENHAITSLLPSNWLFGTQPFRHILWLILLLTDLTVTWIETIALTEIICFKLNSFGKTAVRLCLIMYWLNRLFGMLYYSNIIKSFTRDQYNSMANPGFPARGVANAVTFWKKFGKNKRIWTHRRGRTESVGRVGVGGCLAAARRLPCLDPNETLQYGSGILGLRVHCFVSVSL